MSIVTASKLRQRVRRKRIQISQIEKVLAIQQLLTKPDENYKMFCQRYVSNRPIGSSNKSAIRIKRTKPSYNANLVFRSLLDITNKSMPWKFQIAVKYLEMENVDSTSTANDAYVDKLVRMAKRSRDSVRTLDTRFVSQDTLDRYSDDFIRRVNTKARL